MSIITEDVKRGIDQLRLIEDRFLNETLDPVVARPTLQGVIEGKFTLIAGPPLLSSVNMQKVKVSAFLRKYGGEEGFRPFDIPDAPSFTPLTKSEFLLLTVTLPDKGRVNGISRTFDAWWDCIAPPIGYTKSRKWLPKSESKNLQLVGREHNPGVRWVVFEPNSHWYTSPKDAATLRRLDKKCVLANAEVLMAAALFPEWVLSWDGISSPYPNMSGYMLDKGFYQKTVPALETSSNDLALCNNHIDKIAGSLSSVIWSSPTVRGC